jgi:hypothetical protein
MIKFFRKIRQKLLSENKFSKYLIYAIGEIILVVIGILIALQFNNRNVSRINNQKQNKTLNLIQKSLIKDTLYMSLLINRLGKVNKSISILNTFPAYEDSLSVHFDRIDWGINVQIQSAAYEQLKSTGFDLLQNDALKEELINSYEMIFNHERELIDIELVYLNQNWVRSFMLENFNYIESDSTLTSFITIPKNYELLISNPDYKNLILYKRKINLTILFRLNKIKQTASELIKDIEKNKNKG